METKSDEEVYEAYEEGDKIQGRLSPLYEYDDLSKGVYLGR